MTERAAHVGFYLLGAGLPQLERVLGARTPVRKRLLGYGQTFPVWLYLGAIALVTAGLAAHLLRYARAAGADGRLTWKAWACWRRWAS